MTSAQVVETSVTVIDNSPFQDYPQPEDHTTRSKKTLVCNTLALLFFSYCPPDGTDVEQVVVREMPHPSDPVKNQIICISDLHLDSQWSEGVKERLAEFMEQLKSSAKVIRQCLKLINLRF